MSAQTIARAPEAVCPSWCRYTSGHGFDEFADDIRLSLESKPFYRHRPPRLRDVLMAEASQRRNADPVIDLYHCVEGEELTFDDHIAMTPAEARRLAGRLLYIADQVEGR